jgi:hypothetical protein
MRVGRSCPLVRQAMTSRVTLGPVVCNLSLSLVFQWIESGLQRWGGTSRKKHDSTAPSPAPTGFGSMATMTGRFSTSGMACLPAAWIDVGNRAWALDCWRGWEAEGPGGWAARTRAKSWPDEPVNKRSQWFFSAPQEKETESSADGGSWQLANEPPQLSVFLPYSCLTRQKLEIDATGRWLQDKNEHRVSYWGAKGQWKSKPLSEPGEKPRHSWGCVYTSCCVWGIL